MPQISTFQKGMDQPFRANHGPHCSRRCCHSDPFVVRLQCFVFIFVLLNVAGEKTEFMIGLAIALDASFIICLL